MKSIKKIINFNLHPINTSVNYLNDCKEKLKNKSVLQLDNFLLPSSLKKIQDEAHTLHSKAFYCSQNHTILLNKKSNDLGINDPCNVEVISDKGCVPHDLIPPESDLCTLYNSIDFKFCTTTYIHLL